jgi:hypothetical protein
MARAIARFGGPLNRAAVAHARDNFPVYVLKDASNR